MMDPNPWRSFPPSTYSHLGQGSLGQGLTSGVNRFDLPLLAAEQAALNPGLSLGTGSHNTSRGLGALQGTSLLSGSLPQHLESVSQLQSSAVANSSFKPLPTQAAFSTESAILRSDGAHLYGHPNLALSGELNRQKLILNQEQIKEEIGLNPAIDRAKGWGLSNFMSASPGIGLGNAISSVESGPPPAHGGSVSHKPASVGLHRTSFSVEDLFQQNTPPSKFSSQSNPLFNPGIPRSDSNVTSPTSLLLAGYGLTPDVTSSKTSHQQIQNYNPVSPVSDTGGQHTDHFNDMNLQEFANIAQQKAQEEERHQHAMIHSKGLHHELSQGRNTAGINMNLLRQSSNSPHIHSTQKLHNTPSPLQQPSPHSNSPHLQMSLGSSQNQAPTSTVVTTPPTIQAIPDSTTKPKKPRTRKKKASVSKEEQNQEQKQFQNVHHQQEVARIQVVNQTPQMVSQTPHVVNQTPHVVSQSPQMVSHSPQVMNVSGHGYSSPQTNYPYSPQKKNVSSPQSSQPYSPQLQQHHQQQQQQQNQQQLHQHHLQQRQQQHHQKQQQQHVIEGNYNSSMQRNVPSSSLLGNQSMTHGSAQQYRVQRNSGTGNLPVSSPGNMIQIVHSKSDTLSPSIHTNTLPQNLHPNPSTLPQNVVNRTHVVHNNGIKDRTRSVHEVQSNSGMLASSQFGFTQQAGSFVDQLNSNTDLDMEKVGLDDPLGMQALGLAEGESFGVSAQQTTVYTADVQGYEGQYGYGGSPMVQRQTSTIDEDALSSLIGQPNTNVMIVQTFQKDSSPEVWQQQQHHISMPESTNSSLSVTTNPECDEELAHLSKPPPVKKPGPVRRDLLVNPLASPSSEPKPPEPKQTIQIKKNPNSGFMDSFLSFIQGKKPETLSSVNTAVVKKPELPKYIPEPPRRRPVEVTETKTSSDSAASTPRPESMTSPSTSQNSIAFSDEEDGSNISSTVQNVITSLNEDGKPSLKMKISLNKTSKLVKSAQIVKSNSPVKSRTKKTSPRSGRGKKKKSRHFESEEEAYIVSSGDDDDYQPDSDQNEESEHIDYAPPSPTPVRKVSNRKAKEKKTYVVDSDSDEVTAAVPKRPIPREEEEEEYDSDRDPEWAPFAMDNRRNSGIEGEKKSKSRAPKIKIGRKRSSGSRKSLDLSGDEPPPAPKLKKTTPQSSPVVKLTAMTTHGNVPQPRVEKARYENILLSPYDPKPGFRIGEFVMDRKDTNKFESFPVWKIEQGRMMRKFELITENGKIRHRSLNTFSSWMPKMEVDFLPLRVKHISTTRDVEIVEVHDEDRPKPKLDSQLANAYEQDPLADLFNVYLQIFLSQALEPGFLSAILESGEEFYLGALKSIDKIISKKLEEIEDIVQWKDQFTISLKTKPLIRELDRPNLKMICMASSKSSQPAIKSVHLFGQSYSPVTLKEIPSSSTEGGSVEYMIGKTAADYVMQYHNLYHFKYNLSKRCSAKVEIVRQGNSELENADVLDRCLNNRTWVLKIFDDLKNMLDKG